MPRNSSSKFVTDDFFRLALFRVGPRSSVANFRWTQLPFFASSTNPSTIAGNAFASRLRR